MRRTDCASSEDTGLEVPPSALPELELGGEEESRSGCCIAARLVRRGAHEVAVVSPRCERRPGWLRVQGGVRKGRRHDHTGGPQKGDDKPRRARHEGSTTSPAKIWWWCWQGHARTQLARGSGAGGRLGGGGEGRGGEAPPLPSRRAWVHPLSTHPPARGAAGEMERSVGRQRGAATVSWLRGVASLIERWHGRPLPATKAAVRRARAPRLDLTSRHSTTTTYKANRKA